MNSGRIPLLFATLLTLLCGAWFSGIAVASPIKADEEVVLFTTAAREVTEGTWAAPVHGWVFEPEEDSLWRGAFVRSLQKVLGVDRFHERFRRRVAWFLVDNERGKSVTVQINGSKKTMPASAKNGHFVGELTFRVNDIEVDNGPVLIEVVGNKEDGRRFVGEVLLVPQHGVSIVSDIDDTIKQTFVTDREEMLRRTFLEPFEAIHGMASLYRRWQREGASFHYVSASPWHLYVPLTRFMEASGFPKGTMHLRNVRLKDSSRWNLLKSSAPYKISQIRQLLERFPKRRFRLVGDSGERDPEIYGAIAREYPTQIEAVYIRVVKPGQMSKVRQKRAFFRVRAPVHLFTRGDELP